MTTPSLDSRLSLAALGLFVRLLAHGDSVFNLEDAQQAEPGGMGKDRAIRLLGELKFANYIHRTRGGYMVASSALELFNNSGNSGKSDFPENTEFRLHTCIESSDLRDAVEVPTIPDFPEVSTEPHQRTLDGLPETPSPVPPPPSPGKPARERKPPQPAEVKALYPPLFALTKSPPKGRRAMGCYTIARNLHRDFGATPEQVAVFWEWFKTYSQAAQIAARERRALNAPMPAQVYEAWPQFLPWWEARQEAAARRAEERRRAEEAARQPPPPAADETPRLSGRELYRRTFGLPRPAAALTAD